VVRLRFTAFDVQSEMRKKAPYELALRYTRTMADAMARRPRARHIGLVGLGGGSLPKHAYRAFPQSTVSIAEINPEVIGLRKEFHIPDDDHRFGVSCEDGAEFVCRFEDEFDLLLVDGYDRLGQPPQLCTLQFYRDCCRALAPDGLLIVNICDNHRLIGRIRRAFFDQVDLLDADEKCFNTVVLAHKAARGPTRLKRTGSVA
jgi:spermidine synthase